MPTGRLRDDDLRLAQLIETARQQASDPGLAALRETLQEAQRLIDERNRLAMLARGTQDDQTPGEDPLTGLLNRPAFERLLAQAHRGAEPFTVAAFDLAPEPAPDLALPRVAQIVRSVLRASDLAARLEGQRFALLLRRSAGDRAFGVCERLRLAVARHDWEALQPGFIARISLGYCDRSGADGPAAMLARAEEFARSASESGGNQTHPEFFY